MHFLLGEEEEEGELGSAPNFLIGPRSFQRLKGLESRSWLCAWVASAQKPLPKPEEPHPLAQPVLLRANGRAEVTRLEKQASLFYREPDGDEQRLFSACWLTKDMLARCPYWRRRHRGLAATGPCRMQGLGGEDKGEAVGSSRF